MKGREGREVVREEGRGRWEGGREREKYGGRKGERGGEGGRGSERWGEIRGMDGGREEYRYLSSVRRASSLVRYVVCRRVPSALCTRRWLSVWTVLQQAELLHYHINYYYDGHVPRFPSLLTTML